MNDEDIAHLAGVLDAAGIISVVIAKRTHYELGYEYRPVIRLRRPIRETALMGKLDAYAEEVGVEVYIQEDNNKWELEVYGAENIRPFLEPLVPHLLSRYEPAVIMLEKVLPGMAEEKHLDERGFVELVGLADKLREYTSGKDATYNQDYFEKEWGVRAD